MLLYHFTDTSRLPWIMQAGELRPGANKAGGFPDPEFVWASINALGDLTASVHRGQGYMSGKVRHVRLTFDSAAFIPWSAVPSQFPQWARDHVQRLEAPAIGKSDPATWWCRPSPIALADCLEIATRSYRDNRWQPFDPETEVAQMADDQGMRWLGVEVLGKPFVSARITNSDGRTGYAIR